jgi:hypothetical protein
MKYGAGKSLIAWRKYVPNAVISYIEYDRACAETQRGKVDKLYVGDQGDSAFLDSVGRQSGPFDFVIDDGGHRRTHMLNSFMSLWPYVSSKGVYVIEDLHCTFYKAYADHPINTFDVIGELIKLMTYDAQAEKQNPNYAYNKTFKMAANSIFSVNCYYDACVFVKK